MLVLSSQIMLHTLSQQVLKRQVEQIGVIQMGMIYLILLQWQKLPGVAFFLVILTHYRITLPTISIVQEHCPGVAFMECKEEVRSFFSLPPPPKFFLQCYNKINASCLHKSKGKRFGAHCLPFSLFMICSLSGPHHFCLI